LPMIAAGHGRPFLAEHEVIQKAAKL